MNHKLIEICQKNKLKIDEFMTHQYQVHEVQYINVNRSYNFKRNTNLPNHYTLVLRNHENLSYGCGMQQCLRPTHNCHQNYAPPSFRGQHQGIQRADNLVHKRSQSLEEKMLNFMSENKRILNMHEHKFIELSVFQANTTVFQANTNASLKDLESQVRQLALNMQNQARDS